MIKPTIGRVVWYKDPNLSDQFCDAHICYVHTDEQINIAGFDRDGRPFREFSVLLFQGPAEECPNYQACWMPYQQAQATRVEVPKNE